MIFFPISDNEISIVWDFLFLIFSPKDFVIVALEFIPVRCQCNYKPNFHLSFFVANVDVITDYIHDCTDHTKKNHKLYRTVN